MRRAERGLTLLEVMAAIMLLGILYATLATRTTQGIWQETETRSRLEASLLADQVLAELETQLASGVAPPRGTPLEVEQGAFRIFTEVNDFRPPDPAPDPRAGAAEPRAELQQGAIDVFGDERGTRPSAAVRVDVRVLWDELGHERSVERVTFGFVPDGQMAAAAGAVDLAGGRNAGLLRTGGAAPRLPDSGEVR